MTEIKNIKQWLLAWEETYNPNIDISLEEMSNRYIPYRDNGIAWIASLITTIESQNSQIESLKAITELAVKCLGLISAGNIYFPSWADTVDVLIDVRKVAKETLSEIEKLQK